MSDPTFEQLVEHFGRDAPAEPSGAPHTNPVGDHSASYAPAVEGDAAVILRIMTDPAGPHFASLARTDPNTPGLDRSNADQSLCNTVRRFTSDPAQIERIVRGTTLGGRIDQKTIRPDYWRRTIDKAFDRETAAPSPLSRFKLLSASAIATLPAMRWLVKGVIPEQGVVAIYGPSGSGKSFLANDLTCAIGDGGQWFGYRVKAAPVLYLILEGEAGLRNRLAAWQQQHGHAVSENVRFVADPFALNDASHVAELASLCPQGSVVFIDTLNRAAPGANENDSKDMGGLIEGAKALQRSTGGVVILVSHTGKDAEKGLRGHSSLFAALDAAILVSRERGNEVRSWQVDKAKDSADGAKHFFRLGVETLGEDEDGDPITSCYIAPDYAPYSRSPKLLTPTQIAGMETFREAVSQLGELDASGQFIGLHVDNWRNAFYRKSTAENTDTKKKAFARLRNDLVAAGELVVDNDMYRIGGKNGETENAAIAAVLQARGTRDMTGT